MKISLKTIKSYYKYDISFAKANGYDAVLLPICCEYDIHCIYDANDMDYIYDIALESGWDKFIMIDFINQTDKIVDLYEMEAA